MTAVVAQRLELPSAREFEQGLLGRCLLDGICPGIRLTEWGSSTNRVIHEAMLALDEKGEHIDMVTVLEELTAQKKADRAGGGSYLAQLMEVACSGKNAAHYERHIRATAGTRRVLLACANIAARSRELKARPVSDWIGELQQVIDEASAGSVRNVEPEWSRTILKRVLVDLEERKRRGRQLLGYPTGLLDLDRQTGGVCQGDLVIIAGRPGMGKTALATQIATTIAGSGARVMFFSLEMPREQIQMRILAQCAQCDIKALRTGAIGDAKFAEVMGVAKEVGDLDVIIDDSVELTEFDVRTKARKYKPDVVIVDYLTLLRSIRVESRRDIEVGNISRGLKELAKEMRIPVVLLSQLNRSVEARTNKRPMCSDLRDSGAIEQDADLILLLYRDEVYNSDSREKGTAEIIIGKQRNGPTGTVRVGFVEKSATFQNLAARM